MNTIMVRMDGERWTTDAMHLACTLAKNMNAGVTLVRLMCVQHTSWLGTDTGEMPPTASEQKALREYLAIAAKYDVRFEVRSMQYVSLVDALIEAADYLDAGVVFAKLPQGYLPLWHKFELWNLKRRLSASNRQLQTLEQPANTADWSPAVVIKAAR